MGDIPIILHQTWKNKEVPGDLEKHRKVWLRMSEVNWDYRFYTDEDLLWEVKETFPQYLKAYQHFRHSIERVDFARYVLLYKYGGVYADLDTEPVGGIEELLGGDHQIILGTEPQEHAELLYHRPFLLCNALMMSVPGDSFWVDLLEYIASHYNPMEGPVATTGPLAMTRFYEEYPEKCSDLTILPPCGFYPILGKGIPGPRKTLTLSDGRVLEGVSPYCDPHQQPIYAAHFWANTWVPEVLKGIKRNPPEIPKVPSIPVKSSSSYWGFLLIFLALLLVLGVLVYVPLSTYGGFFLIFLVLILVYLFLRG